ncbi:MAG: LOG family protein [Chloroflexi bacterium]|nr:LOG family protein [Chloroflexota bacterium]
MKITVFGGAAPKPGEAAYEEAWHLGFLLGSAGHTILTGGYIGVMEAASKGAYEAGAHVIGSTCEEIESWRGSKANRWVKEEWKYTTLRERMYALIDACDAAIAMPGGVGTLAELAVMWNEEIISRKPGRLLILVGEGWQRTIAAFFTENGTYISEKDQKRVRFAGSIQEALLMIESSGSENHDNLAKSG